ncbi:hypothetical protein AR1Y2_1883 [Anaerostipes rhamnosivorans]|uniref:Uncharacterized protein n=1 Tax=Anaerostipes rhamnosivorans TaxID=1229621 RepID=A0A4P8IF91_9FIRM|nr:hypothetical protein AR1Y2_1883 [Anaerostipes rhamnosivorans]
MFLLSIHQIWKTGKFYRDDEYTSVNGKEKTLQDTYDKM